MKCLWLLPLLLLPTQSLAEAKLDCVFNDIVEVAADGKIQGEVELWDAYIKGQTFTFDPSSGEFSDGQNVWEFEVIEPGNAENGLTAVRVFHGPADVVVMYFWVATYSDRRFLFAWDDKARSGQCTTAF